jgi:NADPH:quinone reductase-like Zn-dependent oxidoreductase
MEQIRAVVVDPSVPDRLVLRQVPAPTALPSEALVRVAAVSLNLGEVRRAMTAEAGWRPGWDLAGTVERAAADGSGPAVGTRVVGFVPSGAWAEVVPVPINALAVLPDTVSLAQAATLPVAGLTALYALDRCHGALLGRSVLVTGASGGVGYFGCQLARHAGARVVGVVRRPEREQYALEAGAHEVVSGEESTAAGKFAPYHVILESVGGAMLGGALSMLAPDGVCVLYGVSAAAEVTFNARTFFTTGGASLYGFILFHEVKKHPAADGLARLVRLVAAGSLRPPVEVEAPWADIGAVTQKFYQRGIPGKAVLHL